MKNETWKVTSIKSGSDDDLFEAIITADEETKLIAQVTLIETAKQIVDEHNLVNDRTDELVRCLENAIKFVYHYYGDDKEALADMETSTWRTIVKDLQRA